ncbi:hypothetical protein [Paenibacillus sp. LK1]|uniref:hypothetical protein n=1 Tax=Paenibacillus sp. LK1 TaxID=2053014 RepID=UPI000C19636F|nr:hypothetical protein [Paenibacillus sp. LK1]PIH59131.1 hypothetical protein CS562_14425 [Paenibacillus sp. LK1]
MKQDMNWMKVEHTLRFYECEVDNFISTDFSILSDIKSNIIALIGCKYMGDSNITFKVNMLSELKENIGLLQSNYPSSTHRLKEVMEFAKCM